MINTESKTLKLILCALFTALIAIGAFVKVPLPYGNYFTLQFFFVLLAGTILGPYLGVASAGLYVLIGLIGIPIFASGGGIGYVFMPTFGYLIGFVIAAFVVGLIAKKLAKKTFPAYFLATLGGFVVTEGIGIVYMYLILKFYSGEDIVFLALFLSCFPVDIPMDFAICIVIALVSTRLAKAKVPLLS